ncbi:hypothetical protein BV22DRAFT_846382 [Leucogyrophana mollusca]|uniref:Uncharacterized protein n=1 Tax=Leucogyrophana mollusca TaxID=85980 RepID=A0ACB8B1V5_9AGAM|nr:hypothetical protein BV22DRAFT_846382 [Leucogyrophana mollusca]
MVHYPPIVDTTKKDYLIVKRTFLQYMTWVTKDPALAAKALLPGAPLPSLAEIKTMYNSLATSGTSKLGLDQSGWAWKSLKI